MGLVSEKIKLVGSKGEVELEALFDTGATYSLIREDIAERLATLEPLKPPIEAKMATEENRLVVEKRVILDFYIDGHRYSDEFLVVPELRREAIIGVGTMQKWHIIVDALNKQVIIDPKASEVWLL